PALRSVLLPSLSVSASAVLPDLPSVPTRRSSDLGQPGLRAIWMAFLGVDGVQRPRPAGALVAAHSRQPRRPVFCRPVRQRGYVADRKSTRLNSSHGSISYAVFCLKKKI